MSFMYQKTDRGLVCLAMKEGEDRRHRSTFWVGTGWQHLVSEVGMSEKQEGDDDRTGGSW